MINLVQSLGAKYFISWQSWGNFQPSQLRGRFTEQSSALLSDKIPIDLHRRKIPADEKIKKSLPDKLNPGIAQHFSSRLNS